jgi:putative FmdB family regulatory protein
MPLYDYKCTKCGHVFEIQQRISEEPLKYCPQCKGAIKRLISAAGIIFKGSGFHMTDYGKGKKVESPSTSLGASRKPARIASQSDAGGSKVESGKEEAKTTKPESSTKAASPPQSK